MSKFKNCLINSGADFYREVMVDGERLARVRALRHLDRDVLQKAAGELTINADGVPAYTEYTPNLLLVTRVVIALGGEIDGISYKVGDEGWELDEPVTLDTVNLLPDRLLMAINNVVEEMQREFNEAKEALSKN